MTKESAKTIYTIGHSTHSLEEFLAMLKASKIELLVDVRSFPGSRKFPHFKKEALAESLPQENIAYKHIKDLGGRRTPRPESKNAVWRNKSFRGYADYMETDAFKESLNTLKKLAKSKHVAIMCAEAVWWRCHRSMIADALKAEGWEVLHIMAENKQTEHPYTRPAKIVDGELVYKAD